MSALDRNPDNRNFLSPLNWQFQIKRAPNVNFFIQAIEMPSVTLKDIPTSNPFVKIPHTGDHIDYEKLTITFKVDEDLTNYMELYNWLVALGFPDNHDQYADIAKNATYTGLGIRSDVSVLIQTNSKKAKYNVVFYDAFPIALSGFQLNTTSKSIDYITVAATFAYRKFEFLTV